MCSYVDDLLGCVGCREVGILPTCVRCLINNTLCSQNTSYEPSFDKYSSIHKEGDIFLIKFLGCVDTVLNLALAASVARLGTEEKIREDKEAAAEQHCLDCTEIAGVRSCARGRVVVSKATIYSYIRLVDCLQ
jgi:hypothetical protein